LDAVGDSPSSAWQAELRLGFARRGDKTLLQQRYHRGPLTVQRPFYPESNVCHVYVLHPPGGVVAGDELQLSIAADTASHALITTPAAGKFYRSAGKHALQSVQLSVAADASVEWLPQETIVYDGARVDSRMVVDLAQNAGFIGWDVVVLGRPASGEGFDNGQARLHWQIRHDGRVRYRERLQLDRQSFLARWGLAGHSACASLFAYPTTAQHLARVQALLAGHRHCGVTRIDGLLICRGLDHRADQLRQLFEQVWALLRPDIVGYNACPPRIWAT
jgi:urease accessory protein